MGRFRHPLDDFPRRLVAFADQAEPEFVIPEDLSALTDEELAALHEQAVTHFDSVYNGGQGLSEDDMSVLATLTEGIEGLVGELASREEAATARAEAAAALAARAHPTLSSESTPDGEEEEGDPNSEGEAEGDGDSSGSDDGPQTGSEPSSPDNPSVTAAVARREIRVSLPGLRSRQVPAPLPAHQARTMRDIVLASGDGSGFAPGVGVDWNDIGNILDRRLAGFSESQYQLAHDSGRHMRQQFGIATIRKPYDPALIINSPDPGHVDEVMRRAMDESRLPGNSLVAAGGWCAPSETIYDLCELESRDGLVSLPEVGVSRGGINYTQGPDFASIYDDSGFAATEAEAIAGKWAKGANPGDPNVVGDKDCYAVPCPSFTDVRLNVAGVCITANLLQQRGYPEMIARVTRGSLIAHDHKMSAKVINAIVSGSTAVTMTAGQAGTTAPLLEAIELQVEHMRAVNRLARGRAIEAIFPFWIRGAIRADLSRRLGVDLLNVPDSAINGWFSARGVSAQFIYNWQDPTGAPTGWVTWPDTVKFLLYPSGTWVRGGGDMITLDTIFDSTMLATNEFTALFTEEAWLVAKLCHDSRVVTASVCSSGATHGGSDIGCDGAVAAATP